MGKSANGKNGNAYRVAPVDVTTPNPKGSLIVIGGRENKDGHRPILEEVARRAGTGKLVVVTLASEEPEQQWHTYKKVFTELGVKHVVQLDVRNREELIENPRLDLLAEAEAMFFAGGDQMKITSKFGGTQACMRMHEIYQNGGTIAGTSSGASAMSEVMITGGDDKASSIAGSVRLAAGLGLVPGMIIDQHFAERGRMGRLLAAVGQNPRMLGVGIDEDTAIVLDSHHEFCVMGSGAVSVVDGSHVAYCNAAEDDPPAPCIFGVTIHVLGRGDRFDLTSRHPSHDFVETTQRELSRHRS
jgi:cyanophycinase